jgi:pre-rRNA-processing protein TSR4
MSKGMKGPTSSSNKSSTKTSKNQKKLVEKPVELGFLEEGTPQWKLSSAFFPSKCGGIPSWLDLKDIPSLSELSCSGCKGPMRFLLQVYAPLGGISFHRTLFLFVCTEQKCCSPRNSNGNVRVIRCQLERGNEFYSFDPPNQNDMKLAEELSPRKFDVALCQICGLKGPLRCGACKNVSYCGSEHQKLDWKKDGHKGVCGVGDAGEMG